MGKRRKHRTSAQGQAQHRIDYRQLAAQEEYNEFCHRAVSDQVHRALQGRLALTRAQVVDKLNRRRREHG